MKTTLELEDIQAIAGKVVELIRPMLSGRQDRQEDSILDVKRLCEYLKVTPKHRHNYRHRACVTAIDKGLK